MNRDPSLLKTAIEHATGEFTRLEARIAAYLQTRPEAVLLETSAEIARKLDISPMTVTRFFRKLGFDGAQEARAQVKRKTFGPESLRMDLRFGQPTDDPLDGRAEEEAAHGAIAAAFALRKTEIWTKIVKLIATADSVHSIGFQTMYFLGDGLYRRLSFMRSNCHLLDGIDGVYAGLMPAPDERAVLVMIDTFRYGAHGPLLAKLARERGAEVIIFADEFCDWAQGITPYVLRYPAETHFLLALPQGITMGLTLLLQDVAAQLGETATSRIRSLSDAQDYFGTFLD